MNDYRFIVLPLRNHKETNREGCTLVQQDLLYDTLLIKINSITGDLSVRKNSKKSRVFQYVGDLTKYPFIPEAPKSLIMAKIADTGNTLQT